MNVTTTSWLKLIEITKNSFISDNSWCVWQSGFYGQNVTFYINKYKSILCAHGNRTFNIKLIKQLDMNV